MLRKSLYYYSSTYNFFNNPYLLLLRPHYHFKDTRQAYCDRCNTIYIVMKMKLFMSQYFNFSFCHSSIHPSINSSSTFALQNIYIFAILQRPRSSTAYPIHTDLDLFSSSLNLHHKNTSLRLISSLTPSNCCSSTTLA